MVNIGAIFLRLFGIHYHAGNIERINQATWEFFGLATSSIRIVAGELTNLFYSDPRTLQALEKAREKGVCVEIVHGPARDENVAALLQARGVKLYMLDERPRIHFTIVDGKHAKVEDFHEPGQVNRVYYIKYNTEYLAASLEEKFATLKAKAHAEG